MSNSNFVFNVIFWIRVAFGVISGFSAGLLGFTSDNPDANMGIFFGISMYLLSTAIVRQIFLSKIKEGERLKLFTTGIGSFIGLFIFSWIIYNTFFF